MGDMEIKLIAFESMGIRSMCTFVRTPDLAILIDPSAACHTRSGLKPHPIEYEAMIRKRAEMLDLSREADAIVTSHYHLDHLSPSETDLLTTFSTRKFADLAYTDKILFCKDYTRNVIRRQGERGRRFWRQYSRKARRYEIAEGNSFTFGETVISFSPALWHGKSSTVQGHVVGTCISDGNQRVVHSSDVQLLNSGCVNWMLGQNPDLAIVAGPPIFDKERVKDDDRKLSLDLLVRLVQGVPEVVVDHHLLRAADWRDFVEEVGGLRARVKCAADREGKAIQTYESARRSLYEKEEVDEGFHQDLKAGRMPNRLRSVVHETGMEEVFKTPLRW